jgi:hypothetical protein
MHQRNPLIDATQRRQSKQQASTGRTLAGLVGYTKPGVVLASNSPGSSSLGMSGLSPRLPMFFAEPHLPRGPVRGVLDHTMAPPNCTAASQSKPPRLSNGSSMGVHSLFLSVCHCLRVCVCVRMCVRPCMCALPASPPHPPPTLVFAASSFPLLTPNSIIRFCLTCCSPISGCVHMPNSPFDSYCCPL